MYRNYFKEVWELHQQWGSGILFRDILKKETSTITLSEVNGEFYNFAYPTVETPDELNVEEIEKTLQENNEKPVIELLEEHQKAGFIEYLVRQGYVFLARDTWMGYDKSTYIDKPLSSEVIEVTAENFKDFYTVLGKVFGNWPGNDIYQEICRKTISGEVKSDFPGFRSSLFLIYENGKPASGGGMFYSKEGNFAYLHDAGTLEEYRGKGYQSDLIRHRVKVATQNNIDRIYSCVEHGEQSWSNTIKVGFNEMQTGLFFVEK